MASTISADLWLQWRRYGNTPRPPRIGDVVNGICLGELEDDMQHAISFFFAEGGHLDPDRRDRLAKAQTATLGMLPLVPDGLTREYLASLAGFAASVLEHSDHATP